MGHGPEDAHFKSDYLQDVNHVYRTLVTCYMICATLAALTCMSASFVCVNFYRISDRMSRCVTSVAGRLDAMLSKRIDLVDDLLNKIGASKDLNRDQGKAELFEWLDMMDAQSESDSESDAH